MRSVLAISVLICLWSCEKEHNDFWTAASYSTIEAITGDYSLVSAGWSSPIDLSGEGLVTDDILFQLQLYGWTGILSSKDADEADYTSILYRSEVLTPKIPEEHTQINLYVPYPEVGKDKSAVQIQKADRCNIEIMPYQFHYQVDHSGAVILHGVNDRQMSGSGGALKNVSISFEGNRIYFEADTSLYDWATTSWQDGHMSLTYQHN